jgi:hypothetical protein
VDGIFGYGIPGLGEYNELLSLGFYVPTALSVLNWCRFPDDAVTAL